MKGGQFFLAVVAVVLLSALALAQSTQGGSDTPQQLPSGRPLRVRVSSGVARGLLIKKVTPQYPEDALQNRIQGAVVLSAVIGKDGEIKELALVSGHPKLASAALKAVKKWKYRPYLLNGQPVKVETQIVVNFSLTGFRSWALPDGRGRPSLRVMTVQLKSAGPLLTR